MYLEVASQNQSRLNPSDLGDENLILKPKFLGCFRILAQACDPIDYGDLSHRLEVNGYRNGNFFLSRVKNKIWLDPLSNDLLTYPRITECLGFFNGFPAPWISYLCHMIRGIYIVDTQTFYDAYALLDSPIPTFGTRSYHIVDPETGAFIVLCLPGPHHEDLTSNVIKTGLFEAFIHEIGHTFQWLTTKEERNGLQIYAKTKKKDFLRSSGLRGKKFDYDKPGAWCEAFADIFADKFIRNRSPAFYAGNITPVDRLWNAAFNSVGVEEWLKKVR